MPHLYLVDGSGYIFRAYHRLPPLTNRLGEPVGSVYGYTTMLCKPAAALHKADGPTHSAVTPHQSSNTFPHGLSDPYNAHPPTPTQNSSRALTKIRDATRGRAPSAGMRAGDPCWARPRPRLAVAGSNRTLVLDGQPMRV